MGLKIEEIGSMYASCFMPEIQIMKGTFAQMRLQPEETVTALSRLSSMTMLHIQPGIMMMVE